MAIITKVDHFYKKLKRKNKAILAFNVVNLETLKSFIEIAEEKQVDLVIQISQNTIKNLGYDLIVPSLKKSLENSKANFVLHLDHCDDFNLLEKALKDGFKSVMFDGSFLDFKNNVFSSLKAKEMAKKYEAFLEVEIGQILGKNSHENQDENQKTKLEDILEFYNLVKPDSLAFNFGTLHGIYKENPKIDFDLLKNVESKICTVLVMHGTSGLSKKEIIKAWKFGIRKINIGTDFNLAHISAIKEFFEEYPNVKDIRKINLYAIKKIKEKTLYFLDMFAKK
ncbi:class II fructose-bisphosphate aldolase [Mycoplasmopsis pulmonis]|uniref:class II fructose-bisphosphate aldolase n=1 Tax=Mycoplasmopsis pulmonis TaxID=2107 RepID=UPI00100525C9|nr:class II fructose-bisphosphate aldolase [Mycoplasmopsis pulmonis]VEU68122.1 D-tagatose-1,6-bisphosphate aldolase subunit GatY [Mycoplasmopsis pulmonis]